MTDTLPEQLRQKLYLLQQNFERVLNSNEKPENIPISRSSQQSMSKLMGIRIWSFDCNSYANNLIMSLKTLPKQDRVQFYDRPKPKPKLVLDLKFKKIFEPLSADPQHRETILRISKRCSLTDYLMLNLLQRKADQFKIKLTLQTINRSDFNRDDLQLCNSLNVESKIAEIVNLPMHIDRCSPKKCISDLSTCSLKDILQKKETQKMLFQNDYKDSSVNSIYMAQSILEDLCLQHEIPAKPQLSKTGKPKQILRDMSDKKQTLTLRCNPLTIQLPTNFSIILPKNKIEKYQVLKALSQQTTLDKPSRLGIMVSLLKRETNIVNQQNSQTQITFLFKQIARDVGQRRPNRLGLLCSSLDIVDTEQSEIKKVSENKIIQLQLLKPDGVQKCNFLEFPSSKPLQQLEEKVFENNQCQIREFFRSKNVSEDFGNPHNTILLSQTTCCTDSCQNENKRIQPKVCIQYDHNLAKNRKKIEEIKQLIHTSKMSNPVILATYNKTQNTKLVKPPQQILKIARNESTHSNDRRSRPLVAEKTTTQRSVSNEKQVSYMQMSKNYKSPLNRFKKIKYLGKGQVSDVYSVIDTSTGMIAALKIIQKSIITSKGIGKLVKTEIAIQSFVNHPNILKCYGVIDDDKQIALILELGDVTLFNYKKEKKLQEKQIIDIIYQVLSGVEYLHSKSIIHRDIKPENILLQGSVVKLADLGICVQKNEASQYCGTPGYMAPEIIQNQKYDQKVDCYSIGVLLHEMLFNKLPKNGVKINGDTQLLTLLNRLLEINPYQRISCKQALEFDIFKICERKLAKQIEMSKNTIL